MVCAQYLSGPGGLCTIPEWSMWFAHNSDSTSSEIHATVYGQRVTNPTGNLSGCDVTQVVIQLVPTKQI